MNSNREMKDYGHVLKYTGLFGGVQGINILIGLVRNKLVAILLGTSGVGLASLFQTTVNFVSQITNLGISFSAIRHISELFDNKDDASLLHFVKVVRLWSLLTGLIGMLLCIVVGPLLSDLTFSWGNHSLHFVLLSPLVALMAVTSGEMAILKGARQLKPLAYIQIVNVFAALLVSVPVYYVWGASGIVPVMVILGVISMLLTMCFSYRLYPPTWIANKGIVGDGLGMIRLGIAFTLAGIIGSGADFFIRSYLNNVASLGTVGLYNAGYMLTFTYAGMVFSAMETDYFPRLSSVQHDDIATMDVVNKQMEVSLLLLSPMLVALIMFLPVLIPLLLTNAFVPIVGMAQVAALAMFFKVLTLPVAYITLARGDSLYFLMLEFLYFLVFVALIVLGYEKWGIWGTGVAITIAHMFDYVLIHAFAYYKYHYHVSNGVARCSIIQIVIGGAAYFVAKSTSGWDYWIAEAALTLISTAYTIRVLRQKTHLWNSLLQRFRT